MEVTIRAGNWATLGKDAKGVRYEVFVVEQKVPVELEWDGMDEASVHVVAYDRSGNAIGTARLLQDNHIGRMAVLAPLRRSGVGSCLLQRLISVARQRGAVEVMLNAQVSAISFYRRHGFIEEGDIFDDAGIPHKRMRYALQNQ